MTLYRKNFIKEKIRTLSFDLHPMSIIISLKIPKLINAKYLINKQILKHNISVTGGLLSGTVHVFIQVLFLVNLNLSFTGFVK